MLCGGGARQLEVRLRLPASKAMVLLPNSPVQVRGPRLLMCCFRSRSIKRGFIEQSITIDVAVQRRPSSMRFRRVRWEPSVTPLRIHLMSGVVCISRCGIPRWWHRPTRYRPSATGDHHLLHQIEQDAGLPRRFRTPISFICRLPAAPTHTTGPTHPVATPRPLA